MESPQARALALEGTWQVCFDGIHVEPGVVTIENRAIAGRSEHQQIRGDFRIHGDEITAFLRVRRFCGARVDDAFIEAFGPYQQQELVLSGATMEQSARDVRVVLKR